MTRILPTFRENLIQDYTYCGRLYALPHQVQYEGTFINLDVLDALNLDMPSLDWTPEDFAEYLKAATTSTYSGIEKLFMIPTLLTNAFVRIPPSLDITPPHANWKLTGL